MNEGIKICPQCNAENNAHAQVCASCGYVFESEYEYSKKLEQILKDIESTDEEKEKASPDLQGTGVSSATNQRSNGVRPGLTERNGYINGRAVASEYRTPPVKPRREAKHAWKKYIVPVIVVLVLSVSFITIFTYSNQQRIRIDGSFNDWNDLKMYRFNAGGVPDNIDIFRASVCVDGKWVCFYLETKGSMFIGDAHAASPAGYLDIYQVFIDADGDANTGFFVREIGADYLINIGGTAGNIVVRELYRFDPVNGVFNWMNKTIKTNIECAFSDASLETRIQASMIEYSEKTVVLFHTFSYTGAEDFSDYIVSASKSPVVVTLDYTGNRILAPQQVPLLKLTFTAPDNTVTISGFTLSERGTGLHVPVVITSEDGTSVASEISGVTYIKYALQVMPAKPVQINVLANLSEIPAGTAFGIDIAGRDSVTADGVVTLVKNKITGDHAVCGYVSAPPERVHIDGAFADWDNKTKTDDAGDAPAQYDILKFGSVRYGSELNLYLAVDENMLAGMDVPYTGPVKVTGTSGGIVKPAEEVSTYDFVRVYIQSGMPVAGYKIGGIVANYMVEIKGKYGRILEKNFYVFNGTSINAWQTIGSVNAELDNMNMEISVVLETQEELAVVFVTSNWNRSMDYTFNTLGISRSVQTADKAPLEDATAHVKIDVSDTDGFTPMDAPFSPDTPIFSPKFNASNPSCAVAANGNIYVAYQQNNTNSYGVFVRAGIEGDTGTWNIAFSKNSTTTDVRNPSICIDTVTQDIYVAYENATFSFLKYSSNTWAEYYVPGWDASRWKNPSVVAYNNIVYIFYENESTTNPGKYDIGFVNSTDGGLNWDGYYYFNKPTTDERNVSASITSQYVYVAYQNETGGNYNISWYSCPIQGSSWSGWYTSWLENEQYPSISVSGNYGYVVFQDDYYGTSDHDIICFYSTDGFISTASGVYIAHSANDEVFPAVSANGAFANVAYINITGGIAHVSYTNTTNNGQTWLTPLRVNDNDGTVRPYYGCLAVTNKTSGLTLWTENSTTANSLTSIYHAEIPEETWCPILVLFMLLPAIVYHRRKRY